jgi:hypothetical protein
MRIHCSAAAGMALIAVLGLPWLRSGLESGMATHMLVQIPLLAIAGYLLAGAYRDGLEALQDRLDRTGIAFALVAVLVSGYWMLPRALDAALADPWVEAWKFVSVPLLVGLPARLCVRRLSTIAAGFAIANLLSMLAIVGWLYAAFPARLCNYYLLDQQVIAGKALLWIAGLLTVLWLAGFFIGAGVTRERAAHSGATG